MTDLATYLRSGAGLPFVWGERDCCLWACDWIVSRAGVDPALRWRGHYRTAIGAMRLIRKAGGWRPMVSLGMADACLRETADALPGDVGLVLTDKGEALAIRTDAGWAAKSAGGVIEAQFPLVAAWRI